MKARFSKKEIRNNLEAALINEIEKMEGPDFSKKTKKVVKRATRSVAAKVKIDIKKKSRKANREMKGESKKKGKKAARALKAGKTKEDKAFYGEAIDQNGHV